MSLFSMSTKDEVHVWQASLDLIHLSLPNLLKKLSADERVRADRLRRANIQAQFITTRALLRDILSFYAQSEPHEIVFSYNAYGKPGLANQPHGAPLCFNVAHSQNVALVAIAHEREVGVDVEYIDTETNCMEIAERFFSDREIAEFRGLSIHSRAAAFFRGWTRKEAFVKAKGQGLSSSLHQFSVSLAPEEPITLRHNDDHAQWAIKNVPVPRGYVAAIAAEGNHWQLKNLNWENQLPPP